MTILNIHRITTKTFSNSIGILPNILPVNTTHPGTLRRCKRDAGIENPNSTWPRFYISAPTADRQCRSPGDRSRMYHLDCLLIRQSSTLCVVPLSTLKLSVLRRVSVVDAVAPKTHQVPQGLPRVQEETYQGGFNLSDQFAREIVHYSPGLEISMEIDSPSRPEITLASLNNFVPVSDTTRSAMRSSRSAPCAESAS